MARNLQSIKKLLTFELSQYHKSGSMFCSSEPMAAGSDSSVLASLTSASRAGELPQELGVDFAL